MQDLKLDRLFVVYPVDRRYPLADKIEIMPLSDLFANEGKIAKPNARG